jgi:capsular exopolysaccharide synthesis family protein
MDPSPGTRHLLEYWAVLRRRRWVVYLAVATVTLVALVGSFLSTPLYRATTTLQIERHNPDILTFRDLSQVDYSWVAYSDFFQTQFKILGSEAIARKAAESLDLLSHPDFEPSDEAPGLRARVLSLIPRPGETQPLDPLDAAALRVLAGLEIAPVRNSHLVNVSWVSPEPELAPRVANAVVDAYIQYTLESKFSTSDQAAEFLVDQIGTLRQEITAIEERLQTYGEAKNIVSIDDNSNITLRALSDIAQRRTAAQAVLAEKEAAYRAVRESSPEALPEVLHSDLIERLKAEHAQYEAELSEKSELFKDGWPEIETLKSRIEQVRSQLRRETDEIAAKVLLSAEADYNRARAEVANLEALLQRQENAAQRLRRNAVEYANLRAEVDKKRDTLDALMARQNEMALSTRLRDLDATSSNIRVVNRARVPVAPFHPNTRLNLTLGLLLGLVLGLGGVFLLEYLDNTVGSPQELEAVTALPVLAVVPHEGEDGGLSVARMRRKPAVVPERPVERVAHLQPQAPASEAYRELRTSILLSNPGHPPRLLVVTSSIPEEGKSATSVNLAVVLAQMGRKVVVVDTDLRRPRLHKIFDVPNETGVSTYLSGMEEDPDRLLVPTDVPGLMFLPSGPIPPNPSELLNSQQFADLGRELLARGHDHVIFDSPPVLSVADPLIIGSVVDGTILVVRASRTPRQSVRLATEKLEQPGVRALGLVLNDVRSGGHGYGYYRYHYDRGETGRGPDGKAESA